MESKKNEKGHLQLESSKSGDLEMVKFLVEKEKVDINFTDRDGYTALHHAASNGNLTVSEYLIIQGASVDAQTHPKYPMTPLFCSVSGGHVNIAKLLIQNGANTNIVLRNESLFDRAISSDNPDVIDLLLKNGYEHDQYNSLKMTPLSHALRLGKYKSVAFLLERGADYKKRSVNDGFSPLYYAIGAGSVMQNGVQFVNLLLKHVEKTEGKKEAAEYVDYKCSSNGRTALHEACSMRCYTLVKFLLEYGANRNVKDNEGKRPCDLLYESDHRNVCKQIRALFDSDKQQQHSR